MTKNLMDRIVLALLIIGVLALVFFAGGYLGQATFEPKVIVETNTVYEVMERVIYEPIEKVVVKEVPVKLRNFDSLEELNKWLEETPVQLRFGGNLLDCDNCALGSQQKALKDGFVMNFKVIRADEYNRLFKAMKLSSGEFHAIDSVIIGNGVYYIEPQTREVVLAGYLD